MLQILLYFANVGKRFVKSAKIYFADHGLVSYLLDIQNKQDWENHIYNGHLWENLVLMELIKPMQLRPGFNLFFYRDQHGVEIDFVVIKKEIVYLIEAKISPVSSGKLNFNKVQPVFKKYKIKSILAAYILERSALELKEYTLLNPLYVDFSSTLSD